MQRTMVIGTAVVFVAALGAGPVAAQQYRQPYRETPMAPPMVVAAQPQRMESNLGGGFIEFLFGGDDGDRTQYARPPRYDAPPQVAPQPYAPRQRYAPSAYGGPGQPLYANTGPIVDPAYEPQVAPRNYPIDPRYQRQEVSYETSEQPGTVVIDTPNKFLYLVEGDGKALRYGIGVGRPGFTWSGVHKISAKKEWPDWVPPKEMLERQPNLPHFMAGGPNNPLGARAMYLGSTLYRIHGSNEPWTIGHNVSSGCIRLRNADVIDLYGRVKVGAKVVVM
ncbi:MAG: L,D-transpeptidase family protein [Rhodopseudomonas sp.]|nr:L,D-transpeptidase family protein [Rhodopseudomonas sp.]